jgi:hypothetical protein
LSCIKKSDPVYTMLFAQKRHCTSLVQGVKIAVIVKQWHGNAMQRGLATVYREEFNRV